jgi:hypothetical protein
MGIDNHKVPIVRIAEIEPISNADNIGLVRVLGYQVVVRKTDWKVGDLGAYIPPDSVVPETPEFAWLWQDRIAPDQPVPEKYRRITARRFRKVWSEGLLHKLSEHSGRDREDEDVAAELGITHYEPPEPDYLAGDCEKGPSRRQSRVWPRSAKGWYYFLLRKITFGFYDPWGNQGGSNETAPDNTPPIYDVESFKNHPNVFQSDELVVVTEKIHGSNARFVYVPGIFGGGKLYAGSRKLWKREGSNCVWRQALRQNEWIALWCKNHPNQVLYGEVVPTQGGYNYGCEGGEVKFFPFDVRTEDGRWREFSANEWEQMKFTTEFLNWVPVLYVGLYDEERVKSYVDGSSTVRGAKHAREGIVIRTVTERYHGNLGRAQLKIVSNAFLSQT